MEVQMNYVKEIVKPGYSSIISKVTTDIFYEMQKSVIESQDDLERFGLAAIEKYISELPEYTEETREFFVNKMFTLVDSIISMQNMGMQVASIVEDVGKSQEVPDTLDNVCAPVYAAASSILRDQLLKIQDRESSILSRRDFIRLSSTMYDLAQIHVRNIAAVQSGKATSFNN